MNATQDYGAIYDQLDQDEKLKAVSTWKRPNTGRDFDINRQLEHAESISVDFFDTADKVLRDYDK